MSPVEYIINLEKEYILTQRGTIKSVNEEFDVINETYEIMKEDIINSLRVLNVESLFNNFRDNDLKSCGILKYIQTEFNYINNSCSRRFDTVLNEIINKHFGKALKSIKENYNLRTVVLTPTNYILMISSVKNSISIMVHNISYNQNNITEFFNEIKNPVNIDDLRNYWYSKFERKIQI